MEIPNQKSEESISNFKSDQVKEHTIKIILMAFPTFICNLIDAINELCALHYVGLLGKPLYVGAVGLGNMFSVMTVMYVLLGFGNAYLTYSSQSFGNKDYQMLNIYHYRARLLQCIVILPLSAISLYSEKLLSLLGIEKELAHNAYIFTIYCIPFNFAFSQYDVTRTFMRSQQIVNPVMVMSIITSLLGPFIQYYLVIYLDLEIIGCALGKFVQAVINTALLVGYISYTGCCKESWGLPNKKCMTGLMPLLNMGIMASLMISFEGWAYQAINFMAGLLGDVVLAACVALYNVMILIYKSCYGIGVAAGVLVGNMIGAQKVPFAKFYYALSIGIDIIVAIAMSIVLLIIKKWLANIYNTDVGVQALFMDNLFIVCFLEIIDTVNGINANIFTGLGLQKIASICNFISFYIIMLPCAYFITFKLKMGLTGLYYSILIGASTQLVCYFYCLFKADWNQIAINAKKHLDDQKNEATKSELLNE